MTSTPEWDKFLELAEAGKTLFLTGKAGSGKTHLIQTFLSSTKKKYQVLAPTGIAAINAGGLTIHSFFNIRQWVDPEFQDINAETAAAIEKFDWFIIDEVSMARIDLMAAMDNMLKRITMNWTDPFWGKQIIFVWDLFQLPPVVDDEYQKFYAHRFKSPFFFDLPEVRETQMEIVALTKVRRQNDDLYLNLLNHVRVGNDHAMIVNALNTRMIQHYPEDTIILCSTNKLVQFYNEQKYDKLDTKEYSFSAYISWAYSKEMYPTEQIIRVKEWAQIMCIANWEWYCNGTIGKFIGMTKSIDKKWDQVDALVIDVDGNEIIVPKKTRTIDVPFLDGEKLNRKPIGTFEQFPVKLGRAITIHKSQWLTFDKMILDTGYWMFAKWQLYVALSRCRSLSGLYLKKKIKSSDIKCDKYVLDYVKSLKW